METRTNIKTRIALLAVSLALIASATVAVSIFILYNDSLANERARLTYLVESQAEILESLSGESGSEPEVMIQHHQELLAGVLAAFDSGLGFQRTGEMVLSRRIGDIITFVAIKQAPSVDDQASMTPRSLPWGSPLAIPAQLALDGQYGIVVANDYRGRTVLAAYRPINIAGTPPNSHGLVAKIEMGELQRPYVYAGLIGAISILTIFFLTRVIFITLSVPLVERERVREKLEQSETRQQLLLDSTADGIITIAQDGTILSFNKSARDMFGYSSEEILGQNISVLMRPHEGGAHSEYVSSYLEKGKGKIIGIGPRELQAVRKDGSLFHIDLAVNEVFDAGHRIFVGSIRDISTRAERRDQAVRAQKVEAIGQLASGFAADFNGLLMVMLGNLELLEEHIKDDEASKKLIKNARAAGAEGVEITNRLLAFSSRNMLSPEDIDLGELIPNVLALAKTATKGSVELNVRVPDDLKHVFVDRAQMELALLNLCLNACDAMLAGGTLRISAHNVELDDVDAATMAVSPGKYVSLVVEDTGVGMSAEVVESAMQPFFTTKEHGHHSGLGLSLVQGLMHQIGGRINIDSTVGVGTRIELFIPVARSHA